MLILSRKINESVVIDGQITVKIVRIDGDHVRLGIQAPTDVPVHRQEVYDEIQRNNREAIHQVRPKLPRLAPTPLPAAAPVAATTVTPAAALCGTQPYAENDAP
jgi:carbon storage regulator